MPENDRSTASFITIPLSHYCERARWALDRAGLPYREEPHAPLMHRIATTRNAGKTVPVLVHGDDRFIDSGDILRHVDSWRGGDFLYPVDPSLRREVDELESSFDSDLGPHTRRWAYWYLLRESKLIRDVWSRGVPWLEARCVPLIATIARPIVRSAYRITPEGAARSLDRVRRAFRDVEGMLGTTRRYLVGDRFSAADLTFASLAAPMILPAGCRAVMPALDDLPDEMRNEILRLRGTLAGEFVLRIYREEREFDGMRCPRVDASPDRPQGQAGAAAPSQ